MYSILSFIGAGSYGYVYKVREAPPLSRILALKVLRLDQSNAQAQANFAQEARRIANMHHPNILPVYSFGQLPTSKQPYFVMEYAPRTILDLFRNANGSRRLAFAEELVPYIQQTADALQYIHNIGLVHQDVKPGNLLIAHTGKILLADFGTTYYLGVQTHASLGEVTGTAAYMPPEQWQGIPRRDSDQYALAICCYELLAGRTPFVYPRLEEMWNAHFKEPLPPLQRWNPRVPVEVSAVLQRALAKDYRNRYPSITEFAEQYRSAVELALQRFVCQRCGRQNRSGAQRCAFCSAEYDGYCPYCEQPIRFGQRCCSSCGRLTSLPPELAQSPLRGVSIQQGRYIIKRVVTQSDETQVMTAVAADTHNQERLVFLKRWECSDTPLQQRAKELAYYERMTELLARLRHPLLPAVLDRFAEGHHYYMVTSYIDGESLAERMQKLLRPLPEREVVTMMNALLNVLIALEKQRPKMYPYDIAPANLLFEKTRGRVLLTGFQIPPPPQPANRSASGKGKRTTRKLVTSPYLPLQDKVYDARSCIYSLAACMHFALTNVAPPHYPAFPPVRMLNPTVSTRFEALLSRALLEDANARYQRYDDLKREFQALL